MIENDTDLDKDFDSISLQSSTKVSQVTPTWKSSNIIPLNDGSDTVNDNKENDDNGSGVVDSVRRSRSDSATDESTGLLLKRLDETQLDSSINNNRISVENGKNQLLEKFEHKLESSTSHNSLNLNNVDTTSIDKDIDNVNDNSLIDHDFNKENNTHDEVVNESHSHQSLSHIGNSPNHKFHHRRKSSRYLQQSQPQHHQQDIDWQFWGDVMANYEDVARNQPHALSQAIQKGIPKELRGMVWQLMSSSKDTDLEILYGEYLKLSSVNDKAISKDLSRTFPTLQYFQDSDAVNWLFNVAKAYSLYDTECGYTQGLLFVIGPLLLNMPDEEAFCLLVRLMRSYDLRGHYLPEMPGLHLRLYQFERLLEEHLPLLHTHLTRQGVKTSMYASQWYMTLFSYRFPLDLVYRIFDNVFAEGIEAIFRFGIALMKRNEDKLLSLQFENILDFLKDSLYEVYRIPINENKVRQSDASSLRAPLMKGTSTTSSYHSSISPRLATSAESGEWDCDLFVSDAFEVKITPFQLDSYSAEWMETCRKNNQHANEIDSLRLANRSLSSQIKKLESSLTHINTEHCELVKQLVQIKIDKDEMEEDYVKQLVQAKLEKAKAQEELQKYKKLLDM